MSLIIAPLGVEDAPAVRQLLIAGLAERWGRYEAHHNPDIEALARSAPGALILVAKSGGVVVGTGTLRPLGARRAEVVRMSTAAASRRCGVASRILGRLLEHAQAAGVQEVVLETTSTWASAVAFYTRHGFTVCDERDGDTHFVRYLGPSAAPPDAVGQGLWVQDGPDPG